MIALLQRVTQASVTVDGQQIADIDAGLLVFVAVEPEDNAAIAEKLLSRILNYRIFEDDNGRMNLSVEQIHGQLLVVPQFTLAANTERGLRPSFTDAASPKLGQQLFNTLMLLAEQHYPDRVAFGQFGEDMKVSLVNDGPATFWLENH